MLSIFPCSCWPYLCLLWKKCLFRSFAHIVSGSGFLILSYINSLYINLIRYIICKYIILFSRLPFRSVHGFPYRAKDQLPFVYFCYCFPCLERKFQKNIVKTNVKHCAAHVLFQEFYFMVLDLIFMSLIHLQFIFINSMRKCSNYILLLVSVQFS